MDLIDSKDPKQIEKVLMSVFPEEKWVNMASRIIFRGRITCPANRYADDPNNLGDLCVMRD